MASSSDGIRRSGRQRTPNKMLEGMHVSLLHKSKRSRKHLDDGQDECPPKKLQTCNIKSRTIDVPNPLDQVQVVDDLAEEQGDPAPSQVEQDISTRSSSVKVERDASESETSEKAKDKVQVTGSDGCIVSVKEEQVDIETSEYFVVPVSTETDAAPPEQCSDIVAEGKGIQDEQTNSEEAVNGDSQTFEDQQGHGNSPQHQSAPEDSSSGTEITVIPGRSLLCPHDSIQPCQSQQQPAASVATPSLTQTQAISFIETSSSTDIVSQEGLQSSSVSISTPTEDAPVVSGTLIMSCEPVDGVQMETGETVQSEEVEGTSFQYITLVSSEDQAETAAAGEAVTSIQTSVQTSDLSAPTLHLTGLISEDKPTSAQDILTQLQQNPESLQLKDVTHSSEGEADGGISIKLITVNATTASQLNAQAVGTVQASGEVMGLPSDSALDEQTPVIEYNCASCPYTTNIAVNFYRHKKTHTQVFFPCIHCDYKAAKSSNLRRHMLTHTNVKDFACGKCNMTFRQKIHLQRHIKYKHEDKLVQCEYCDYVCASYNPDLKLHMLRRHLLQANESEARTTLRCTECGFVAASKRDLGQHRKFHRAGPELKLFCELCSFVTDCESRLKRHMFVHSKERPYVCDECPYRATQKVHVERHKRVKHSASQPQSSKKSAAGSDDVSLEQQEDEAAMGMGTESETNLENGELAEQSEVVKKSPRAPYRKKYPPSDFSKQTKSFACSQCTMTFAKLLNLYKHLQGQHGLENPGMVDNLHTCLVCDYHTSKKANLVVHMRKHNPANGDKSFFSCMMCSFSTPRRPSLYQHMSRKHNMHVVMNDNTSMCGLPGMPYGLREPQSSLILSPPEEESAAPQRQTVVIQLDPSLPPSTVQIDTPPRQAPEEDAAQAIEGLTALAGQTAEPSVETSTEVTIENSSDTNGNQVMEVTAGDLIEIDGEIYKVEFTASNS